MRLPKSRPLTLPGLACLLTHGQAARRRCSSPAAFGARWRPDLDSLTTFCSPPPHHHTRVHACARVCLARACTPHPLTCLTSLPPHAWLALLPCLAMGTQTMRWPPALCISTRVQAGRRRCRTRASTFPPSPSRVPRGRTSRTCSGSWDAWSSAGQWRARRGSRTAATTTRWPTRGLVGRCALLSLRGWCTEEPSARALHAAPPPRGWCPEEPSARALHAAPPPSVWAQERGGWAGVALRCGVRCAAASRCGPLPSVAGTHGSPRGAYVLGGAASGS